MLKMIRKIRIILARRRLANALRHEAELRDSAAYARRVLIPALERKLEARELELMSAQFLAGVKRVR